jgi:hypothetical protein
MCELPAGSVHHKRRSQQIDVDKVKIFFSLNGIVTK